MESKRSQELIHEMKTKRIKYNISFPRILAKMDEKRLGGSLSTLRRVFADNSETNASKFGYENILIPISEAIDDIIKDVDNKEKSYDRELDALKAVIHCQNEELNRVIELNEYLEQRITFLLEQIEKKDRRMDAKDETIRKLMDKLL